MPLGWPSILKISTPKSGGGFFKRAQRNHLSKAAIAFQSTIVAIEVFLVNANFSSGGDLSRLPTSQMCKPKFVSNARYGAITAIPKGTPSKSGLVIFFQ